MIVDLLKCYNKYKRIKIFSRNRLKPKGEYTMSIARKPRIVRKRCIAVDCDRGVYTNEECSMHLQRTLRKNKRAELISLLGGCCVTCGKTEELEFDHIDHTSVDFRIGSAYMFEHSKLMKELKKCQLLCVQCHKKKTVLDLESNIERHGTPSYYSNHNCRCIKCKEAWAAYIRSRRRRVL